MPYYVLNRNFNFHSTLGGASFVKGEPTWVIPEIEKQVIAIGAVRADGDTPDVLEDAPKLPQAPVGADRENELFAAFDLLAERNESRDFTAQGVPTVKSVEKITGFDVDKLEVVDAWAAYKVAKAEAQ